MKVDRPGVRSQKLGIRDSLIPNCYPLTTTREVTVWV